MNGRSFLVADEFGDSPDPISKRQVTLECSLPTRGSKSEPFTESVVSVQNLTSLPRRPRLPSILAHEVAHHSN